MRIASKLQNPVALMLQGFIAGGIIFVTLQPLDRGERPPSTIGESSVLETLQAS